MDTAAFADLCSYLFREITIPDRRKIFLYLEMGKKDIEGHEIEDDAKFINKLRDRGFLSVTDVSPLIACFRKLKMVRLQRKLEEYQRSASGKTTTDVPSETSTTATIEEISSETEETEEEGKTEEPPGDREETTKGGSNEEALQPQQPSFCDHAQTSSKKRSLCITCYGYYCYKCAFLYHKKHEVFTEKEISDELVKRQEKTKEGLSAFHAMVESFVNECNTSEGQDVSNKILQEVNDLISVHQEAMRAQHDNALISMTTMETDRTALHKNVQTRLQELHKLNDTIRAKINSSNKNRKLQFLQKVNTFITQLTKGVAMGESIISELQHMGLNILIKGVSLSPEFISITNGHVVGATRVNANQVIIYFDERHKEQPGVRISCLSCEKPHQTYWSHTFPTEDSANERARLVPCNTLFVLPRKLMIPIGNGQKMHVVEVEEPGDYCFYKSVSTHDISASLPEGASITHINTTRDSVQPGFIVLDSISDKIHFFDRNIQHSEMCSIAGCDKAVALLEDESYKLFCAIGQEMALYKSIAPQTKIRTLDSPKGDAPFYPIQMFHDGSFISVLWVHKGQLTQEYRISIYREDGTFVRDGLQGTCPPNVGVVGISFVKNDGLVCLSNGSVTSYETME